MTRIDALRALYKAVKAVEAGWYGFPRLCEPVWPDDDAKMECARSAYNGSLDAALALHEAVLPGWGYAIERGEACVWHPDTMGVSRDITRANTPARAWLLAIIAALIDQAEKAGKGE